jgi:hypothetical protein
MFIAWTPKNELIVIIIINSQVPLTSTNDKTKITTQLLPPNHPTKYYNQIHNLKDPTKFKFIYYYYYYFFKIPKLVCSFWFPRVVTKIAPHVLQNLELCDIEL